jgi:hypothetical protein
MVTNEYEQVETLPRIVYLAAEYSPKVPKAITRWLPQGELIEQVANVGLRGAEVNLNLAKDQLNHLYKEGKRGGKGSVEEFRVLVSQAALGELELQQDEMPLSSYLAHTALISKFLEDQAQGLIRKEDVSFSDAPDIDLVKWNSGFTPIDSITGGLYQGIFMIIAPPGTGKTSLLLSLMEACRIKNSVSSIWFFQPEIPMPMMLYRTKKIRARTQFIEDDRLFCGMTVVDDIIEMVKEDPDPERLVIFDLPDITAAGGGDTRRFALEDIYRGLVVLKPYVKCIFTTSQPKQTDKNIQLNSGAEAWAKAWYTDGIIGVSKLGMHPKGGTKLRLNIPKNRFGEADKELTFSYNYNDLSWQDPDGLPTNPGDWGEVADEDGDW